MTTESINHWRMSPTIMSAVKLGRLSAADQAALDRKREQDRRDVDAILAGAPDPAIRRERLAMERRTTK